MTDNVVNRRIDWYRVPLAKETLQALNRHSDLRGLLQMLPFIGLLTATGGAAIYGAGRWPWPLVALVVFLHGTFFAFLLNAFHELCHHTVFRSKFLNVFFLRLIEPQLPPTPRGLYATWKHINQLMQRQEREPGWQYQAPLPPQPV